MVTVGPQRLAPPANLPEAARKIFIDVVVNCRPEAFQASDLPLLCRFCEASALAEQAAAAALAGDTAALGAWATAARTQSALAMRLRLSPQARQPNRPNRPVTVSVYERMALERAAPDGDDRRSDDQQAAPIDNRWSGR